MTVRWQDDLESGGFTNFGRVYLNGTGASAAANAASAYAGSYGADCFVNGASGDGAEPECAAQTITTSVCAGQARLKFHQMNVGATGGVYVIGLHDSAITKGIHLHNLGGTWRIVTQKRDGSGEISLNLTQQTWTADTWYLVELVADWSGTNEVYTCYRDGALVGTLTDTSVGTNQTFARVYVGPYATNSNAGAIEVYADNIKLGDALIGLPAPVSSYAPALRLGVPPGQLAPEAAYAL